MQDHLIWILLAGLLLVGEMLSGTFYLLVIAIAFSLTALLAWLGGSMAAQLLLAALLSLSGLAALWRRRSSAQRGHNANNDLLDLGQQVSVVAWLTPQQARAKHRGAEWDAELVSGRNDADAFFIVGIRGATLLLSDRKPEN